MIIASGGLGLINGAISITTESFRDVFELVQFTILFLSCYSIPIEYFPEILQGVILVNPFYHGVDLARNILYGTYSITMLFSLIYIIIFAIIKIC